MYSVKSKLFLNLTKIQKSSLLNFLKIFVKKKLDLTVDEIFYAFLDEQNYYLEINNPQFEWIYDYIQNDKFIKELKIYINAIKKDLKYKEAQKPFVKRIVAAIIVFLIPYIVNIAINLVVSDASDWRNCWNTAGKDDYNKINYNNDLKDANEE